MSDPAQSRAVRAVILECLLAGGLGLLLLAASAAQQLRTMNRLSADWGQLSTLLGLDLGGTPLGTEVAKFVGWQVALHLAFGLTAWVFAWLTVRAFNLGSSRLRIMCAWFVAGVTWLLVANATLFPWSVTGIPGELVRTPIIGSARLLELISILLLAAVLVIVVRAARRFGPRVTVARVVVYPVAGILAVVLLAGLRGTQDADAAGQSDKPHLVVIGIDSLRTDVVGAGRGPGLTPHIDNFVRNEAQLFTDAITPLARTFPAWTSILTGRYPRATGARENLVARSSLSQMDTLADLMRASGYRTIFATDEVRFSNIDTSFGFDQAITPTVGAADFLLGKANDLPLANLVANCWLGKWMFPATYGNRAATVTYRPHTFIDWLDDEIEVTGPTLLAVHLTLPHYPFTWSAPADQGFGRVSDTASQYSNAVIAADEQFGRLMELLERKGMLRNAMVVVLSDHGEALGLPESDALIRGAVVRDLLDGQRISLWGHGSSVLSPNQFSAFLALRGFGSVDLPRAFHQYDAPVSLVDIAPTALDVLGVRTAARFDGASLRPLISRGADALASFDTRVRFTETGFRTQRIAEGDFSERSVLGEAAAFFRMNPLNGRFEVRQELMPALLADKERAALSRDWLLAAVPNRDDTLTHKYVLVSRHDGSGRRLEAAPDPGDAPAFALWQALHEQFGEELLPPARRAAAVAASAN